jgi:hypothetical protein
MVVLAVTVDHKHSALSRAEQLAYLPNGKYLRLAVLGYRQLAADLIWLQAVQHIGAKKDSRQGYAWTYHAVDVLTDLDPQFVPAYYATGLFLGALVGRHDEGTAILTKGMQFNPGVWQLPFLAGYIAYYERCDPVVAGQYLRVAAQVPGAPSYLPKLASRMTVESGDPDAALEFLERFSRNVRDERVRESLAVRMKEVMQERDLRELDRSSRRYYSLYHRYPTTVEELVLKGMIRQLPSDPLGGTYYIDATTGIARASSRGDRLKLHERVACARSAE